MPLHRAVSRKVDSSQRALQAAQVSIYAHAAYHASTSLLANEVMHAAWCVIHDAYCMLCDAWNVAHGVGCAKSASWSVMVDD